MTVCKFLHYALEYMDLLCLITFFLSTYSFLSYELIDQLEADSSRWLS